MDVKYSRSINPTLISPFPQILKVRINLRGHLDHIPIWHLHSLLNWAWKHECVCKFLTLGFAVVKRIHSLSSHCSCSVSWDLPNLLPMKVPKFHVWTNMSVSNNTLQSCSRPTSRVQHFTVSSQQLSTLMGSTLPLRKRILKTVILNKGCFCIPRPCLEEIFGCPEGGGM